MTHLQNPPRDMASTKGESEITSPVSTRASWGTIVVAGLFLSVYLCLFFRAPILQSRAFHAWDHGTIYVPMHVYNARLRAAGEIPLWNRHGFLGWPTQAESELSGIYPPTLIFNAIDDGQ